MNLTPFSLSAFRGSAWRLVAALLLLAAPVVAETCLEAGEIDPATRAAIEDTARNFQQMSARGDAAGLRAASIPSVAGSFAGIEQAVLDNQQGLNGTAVIRKTYLLEQPGPAPNARAEFFCGVFGANGNTVNSAGFVLPNLEPGRYALVIMDISGPKVPYMLSLVLQQMGAAWKLAGYYAKPAQIAGHDSDWYVQKAREFKQKGQFHNAWFYFWQAREMAAAVPFMSTLKLDKLYEEAERARPADLPTNAPVAADLAGRNFKLTAAFPVVVSDQLDLVVKYESPDISNTAQTFADNTAVMRGLVAKYPELREGFSGIVVRAVAPNGQDYGTLLAMKDIK
jgi:hypothetical protein